jgi:hypothetical protein
MYSLSDITRKLAHLYNKRRTDGLTPDEAAKLKRFEAKLEANAHRLTSEDEEVEDAHQTAKPFTEAEIQQIFRDARDPETLLEAAREARREKQKRDLRAIPMPTYSLRRRRRGSDFIEKQPLLNERGEDIAPPRACLAAFLVMAHGDYREALTRGEGVCRVKLALPTGPVDAETAEAYDIERPTPGEWKAVKAQYPELEPWEYYRELQLRKLEQFADEGKLDIANSSIFTMAASTVQVFTLTLVPKAFITKVFKRETGLAYLHYGTLLFSTSAVDRWTGLADYRTVEAIPLTKDELDVAGRMLGRGSWVFSREEGEPSRSVDGEILTISKSPEKRRGNVDVQSRVFQPHRQTPNGEKGGALCKGMHTMLDVRKVKARLVDSMQQIREVHAKALSGQMSWQTWWAFYRRVISVWRKLKHAVQCERDAVLLDLDDVVKVNADEAYIGQAYMAATYLEGREYRMNASSQYTQMATFDSEPQMKELAERVATEQIEWKLRTPEGIASLASTLVGRLRTLSERGELDESSFEAEMEVLGAESGLKKLDVLRIAALSGIIRHTVDGQEARANGRALTDGMVRMPQSLRRRLDSIVASLYNQKMRQIVGIKKKAHILLSGPNDWTECSRLWGYDVRIGASEFEVMRVRHLPAAQQQAYLEAGFEAGDPVRTKQGSLVVGEAPHDTGSTPWADKSGMRFQCMENAVTGERLSREDFERRIDSMPETVVLEDEDGNPTGTFRPSQHWRAVYSYQDERRVRAVIPDVIVEALNGDNDGDHVNGVAAHTAIEQDIWRFVSNERYSVVIDDFIHMGVEYPVVKMVEVGRYPQVDSQELWALPAGTRTPFDPDEEEITLTVREEIDLYDENGESVISAQSTLWDTADTPSALLEGTYVDEEREVIVMEREVPLHQMTEAQLLQKAQELVGEYPQLSLLVEEMIDGDVSTGEARRRIDEAVNAQAVYYRMYIESFQPSMPQDGYGRPADVHDASITRPNSNLIKLLQQGAATKKARSRSGEITFESALDMALAKARANRTGQRTRKHERFAVILMYSLAKQDMAESAIERRNWRRNARRIAYRMGLNSQDIEREIKSWKKMAMELFDPYLYESGDLIFDSYDDVMAAVPLDYHQRLRKGIRGVLSSNVGEFEQAIETLAPFKGGGKEPAILNHVLQTAGRRIVDAFKSIHVSLQPYCQELKKQLSGKITDQVKREAKEALDVLEAWRPAVADIMETERQALDDAAKFNPLNYEEIEAAVEQERRRNIAFLMRHIRETGARLSKEAVMLAVYARWSDGDEGLKTSPEIALMGDRLPEIFPRRGLTGILPEQTQRRESVKVYARGEELKTYGLDELPGSTGYIHFDDLAYNEEKGCFVARKGDALIPLHVGEGEALDRAPTPGTMACYKATARGGVVMYE